MNNKPRPKNQSILTKRILKNIGIEGLIIAAATVGAYSIGLMRSDAAASTMAFATLCLSRLIHGLNCKSEKPVWFKREMFNNKSLIAAFLIGLALLSIVMFAPVIQPVFSVEPLGATEILSVYGLSLCTFIVIQAIKAIKK